jgi:hypothetical protein
VSWPTQAGRGTHPCGGFRTRYLVPVPKLRFVPGGIRHQASGVRQVVVSRSLDIRQEDPFVFLMPDA